MIQSQNQLNLKDLNFHIEKHQNKKNVEKQSTQISNQIARILYSDHSAIECDIQTKIQTIDQCLTSRSHFLSMFQQMLKKQMGIKQENQFYTQSNPKCRTGDHEILKNCQKQQQYFTNRQEQNIKQEHYFSTDIQKKSTFQHEAILQSQVQTARQFSLQNQFFYLKKQIYQSSFDFTSRQSDNFKIAQKFQNEQKTTQKQRYLTNFIKTTYLKTIRLSQECNQMRQILQNELKNMKRQLKQLVNSSLSNIVEIINSMYQKKIEQLMQQTQKFKNQTKRLKEEISFRNLTNSNFFNQFQHNDLFSSSAKQKESQKLDYLQNTFSNIPINQLKFNGSSISENFANIQMSIKDTSTMFSKDQLLNKYSKPTQLNYSQKYLKKIYQENGSQKYLNNLKNSSPFLQQSSINCDLSINNNNSFNSYSQGENSKDQWRQIKFFLKKEQKQNQFQKNKNQSSIHINSCISKKAYNNFYDFQPLEKIQIKYPPILDGYATISQSNIQYKGNWRNGLMHGKGKLCTNNFSYQGQFWYGAFDGKGTYKNNTLQYIGQFKSHKVDGFGCLLLKKQKIQGLWKQNKFIRRN